MVKYSKADLERMQCGTPGCVCMGKFFRPTCHPGKGLVVMYEDGYLYLSCRLCDSECNNPQVRIEVK